MKSFGQIRAASVSKSFVFAERREKTRFSMPVPILTDGMPCELLFLTDMSQSNRENNTCARPYAWMRISAETGALLQYTDCSVQDFVDTAKYPPDRPISNLIDAVSREEFTQGMDRLNAAYEVLRSAYLTGRSVEAGPQLEEAKDRYRTLFFRLIRRGQYPFYMALNPDFYAWLGMTDGMGGQITKEAKEEQAVRPEILEALNDLRSMFKSKILNDEHRNTLFDSMHKELVDYHNEANSKPLVSIALDAIALLEFIAKARARIETRPADEQLKAALKSIGDIEEEVGDILYRAGFESYTCDGDTVDIKKQKIISYTPTDDALKVNRIAARLGSGYEFNGRIIRPERVSVYKMQ